MGDNSPIRDDEPEEVPLSPVAEDAPAASAPASPVQENQASANQASAQGSPIQENNTSSQAASESPVQENEEDGDYNYIAENSTPPKSAQSVIAAQPVSAAQPVPVQVAKPERKGITIKSTPFVQEFDSDDNEDSEAESEVAPPDEADLPPLPDFKELEETEWEDQDNWENLAGLYPDLDDPRFIEKLMEKREFAEAKQADIQSQIDAGVNPCDTEKDFELTPVQRFVSTFLSPSTPYQGALLYHGVGVGKTCAAITIAEGYLERYPQDEVYILAPPNIQPNFEKTIFDAQRMTIGKGEEQNTINSCTGNTYLALTGTLLERDPKIIQNRVKDLVKSRYKIFGYIEFAGVIKRILERFRPEEEELANEEIRKTFSGKMLIIDEAHNLRDMVETESENLDAPGGDGEVKDAKAGKILTGPLKRVLSVADGLVLVLLTGTPMFNNHKEIISLLNLLLINDKVPQTDHLTEAIFDPKSGILTTAGAAKLGKVAQRYVSFMRGENPLSFPTRLMPVARKGGVLPTLEGWPIYGPNGELYVAKDREGGDTEGADIVEEFAKNSLPIIPCEFEGETAAGYLELTEKVGKDLGIATQNKLIQAGNFIYPKLYEETILTERIEKGGFDLTFDKSGEAQKAPGRSRAKDGTIRTPNVQYENQIEDNKEWLLEQNLGEFSPKTKFFLEQVRHAKGCSFIYSRFVPVGALSIALALEANGYTLYGAEPGRGLLKGGALGSLGRQCAMCPAREKGHTGHPFVPAKYVLLTGNAELSPSNEASIQAQRRPDNKDGSKIKIVIGSQVAGEGIDLKFIREIYIFDSWFHLNKTEQVVGRGIRTCSHALLPKAERNCTVYLLANAFSGDAADRETVDLYTYRTAVQKAIQVGRVSRVLKEYGVDCNLNREAISITKLAAVPMVDSQGNPRSTRTVVRTDGSKVEIPLRNDTPFSALCDWMERCESFQCKPSVVIDADTSTDKTYTEYSAKWREHQLIQKMKNLFKTEDGHQQAFISIEGLEEALLVDNVPQKAISMMIHNIIRNKSLHLELFGKQGHIIYKNGYFLFQPDQLRDEIIPLALRVAPFPPKRDAYAPVADEAIEITAEGDEAEEETSPLWDAVETWIENIDKNENKKVIFEIEKGKYVPPRFILTVLKELYENDETLLKIAKERLGMVGYLYEKVKDNEIWKPLLMRAVKEAMWDEFLTSSEQFKLVMSWKNTEEFEEHQHLFRDQYIEKGERWLFRFIDLHSGEIKYRCEDGDCKLDTIEELTEGDSNVVINTTTTAYSKEMTHLIYGFLVPAGKENQASHMAFKTARTVVANATLPSGLECSTVSNRDKRDPLLTTLAAVIDKLEDGIDLGLDEESIKKIKGSFSGCFLLDLALRMMDFKQSKKRFFYRSIESYKGGHVKLEEKKRKSKSKKVGEV